MLPSGAPCSLSSCIYFKNSVYCFGGNNKSFLPLSSRFDLDQNRWIKLTPMPRADCKCNSIIFNGNILISGWENRNLWLYSFDIDSFSIIPYELQKYNKIILINAERLYLIECKNGSIYESEIGSYTHWRRIRKLKINCNPKQVYCSYNKGFIYISTMSDVARGYYYFNLDRKIIIDVAYSNPYVSLRRDVKTIEAIKWNHQNFNLEPYYLDEWNLEGRTLNTLGENIETVEFFDKAININPKYDHNYDSKGKAFYRLKRYLEAIECYDVAIKLKPNYSIYYNNKGDTFYGLKRYLEAIECYSKAIKLNPNKANYYNNKGDALNNLWRYLEAIECYNEAINLSPGYANYYDNKGDALNSLGRYLEAKECYSKAKQSKSNQTQFKYR